MQLDGCRTANALLTRVHMPSVACACADAGNYRFGARPRATAHGTDSADDDDSDAEYSDAEYSDESDTEEGGSDGGAMDDASDDEYVPPSHRPQHHVARAHNTSANDAKGKPHGCAVMGHACRAPDVLHYAPGYTDAEPLPPSRW